MKKSRRKARTGNSAAEARNPPGPRPKDKSLGRALGEWVDLFFRVLLFWRRFD
jgi:hypothetical protein